MVAPIFGNEGVDASNNKIVSKEFDEDSKKYFLYECLTPLDQIWKRLLKRDIETLEWKRERDIYYSVEQMPEFPGGEEKLFKYIQENIQYLSSVYKGVEGCVYIRFVVLKDGSITDITVLRTLDPDCDKEAVRLIKNMPKWNPGKQNGIAVDVYYTLPIIFRLPKEK